MAAERGLNASVLFDAYDLSTFLRSVAPATDVDLLDGTTFQAPGGDKIFITGFSDGRLSMEGFFDSDEASEDEIDDVFNSVIGSETKQVVTVSPEGADTLGNRCFLMDADTVRYEVSSPAKELIMCNAECQSSGGVGAGVILQPLEVLDATGNGTSVNNGAASSNGGAGHIHVTLVAGSTPTLDVKIQHSTDNAVWVDLITFTQLDAVGSERIEVTGTVNQYLRAIRTVAGSGAEFTTAVAFARF